MQDSLLPQPVELAQIILQSGPSETRERVQYIGAVEGQSVMITHPARGQQLIVLTRGDQLTVKLVSRRSLLSFHSSVVRVCTLPFPYVHLTWPRHVTRSPLRKHPRINTNIAGTAELNGRQAPVRVCNLSLDGARIEALAEARPGDQLKLSFSLPGDTRSSLNIAAAVRNAAGRDESKQLGVEFVDLTPEVRGALAEFLLIQTE
jgi:hypothetical protein